ncbi:MAG: tRNA threonylcarbamoyladenosine dehydratase [Kiritimatiellae bacterium]|nr:tRNA threonylcarbamoyladenosine dehydratase [Kiritimatiellia bacterium]MDD5520608.1 tRNA threonylcarbamoyladenosine dehydratase [Kiritimatiellia bacterium]
MKTDPNDRDHSRVSKRDWKFERCIRLFGSPAMHKLEHSHVAIFGLGGIGSYAVEGLARSGVGCLTLVDFDNVCVTNINRQLHAFPDNIGKPKANLMAERVRIINPKVEVRACNEFYDKNTSAKLMDPRPDAVIDCIDNVTAKMHLVATCVESNIPIITTLGAGAKMDPTRIRIVPLAETHTDPLGRALRKHIRRKYDITDAQLASVVAVFSDEPVMPPVTDHGDIICGVDCFCPDNGKNHYMTRRRHMIYGTAVFVTSVFGMAAASAAVRLLLGKDPLSRKVECEICGNIVDPSKGIKNKKKKSG